MPQKIKIKIKLTQKDPQKRRQEILSGILKNRGITTPAQKKEFLNPIHPRNYTPKKLGINSTQLKKAVTRIKKAIQKKELIYIYGDFDADGITATAVLWETLHHLKANVWPYIPARDDKIRGLSPDGIDQIIDQKKQKPALIITVDNGISAFKGASYAKKKGIEVIITDHHQPKENKLPQTHSIVHTTKLAGVGVSWYLARQLKPLPQLLGLTALGTITDMMPLVGPNRSIAKFGLKVLQKSTRPGLKALADQANLDLTQLQAYQASFTIGPRLNAMGRLSHALDSLRLLCTTDSTKAQKLAKTVSLTNQSRQDQTLEMFNLAQNIVKKQSKLKNALPKLIFIADKSFHKGLVGLVASRLSEKFHRPAVVVALGKNHSKASVRSINGFNIIKNLRLLEKYLLEHGGHPMAAGFTLNNQSMEKVKTKLTKLAEKQLTQDHLTRIMEIDCQLEPQDINWQLLTELENLKPFGFGNPQPIFLTNQIPVESFKTIGQDHNHLKLNLQGPTLKVPAIAFNFGSLANDLFPNQPVDIIYTLEVNHWNNQKSLQLKVKHLSI